MQAITGTIGLIGGLTGMFGGLRGAKVGAGIGPLFSILSGQEQQRAAQEEARLLGVQSDIAYEESLRDAAQREREVKAYKEEQALRFASSGGMLAGSPLGILEETRQLGQQEVEAIKRRGEAASQLLSDQGLQMLRRGSAAAFGGFAQSLQMQFNAKQQRASTIDQSFQTGLAGIGAFTSGIGAWQTARQATRYGPTPGFTGPSPLTTIHGPI